MNGSPRVWLAWHQQQARPALLHSPEDRGDSARVNRRGRCCSCPSAWARGALPRTVPRDAQGPASGSGRAPSAAIAYLPGSILSIPGNGMAMAGLRVGWPWEVWAPAGAVEVGTWAGVVAIYSGGRGAGGRAQVGCGGGAGIWARVQRRREGARA